MMTMLPTSAATTTTTFEPILNVPALTVFLLITVVYGGFFLRVQAIQKAIERRTDALDQLRVAKTRELVETGATTKDAVEVSSERFRQAVEEVERLRTVVPGGFVRIPVPVPTMVEQEATDAARQFLGIVGDETSSPPGTVQDKPDKELSPFLVALLAVVALSQVTLLALLATDPMSSSSSDSGMLDAVVDAMTGME
jgi:hypothetical protein